MKPHAIDTTNIRDHSCLQNKNFSKGFSHTRENLCMLHPTKRTGLHLGRLNHYPTSFRGTGGIGTKGSKAKVVIGRKGDGRGNLALGLFGLGSIPVARKGTDVSLASHLCNDSEENLSVLGLGWIFEDGREPLFGILHMCFVIAANSIAKLLVVEAGRERFILMIGFLFGLFALRERSRASSVGNGIKGITEGDGSVVDFGDETVVELLLLFRLRAVFTTMCRAHGEHDRTERTFLHTTTHLIS